MKFIRATIMFISLEFSLGFIFYCLFYSGAYELIKQELMNNLPIGFGHYNLFTNMSNAVYWSFIGVMVGLVPAYFLHAVNKESVESDWRQM